jgi:predicted  nucleic acid-binding Zn-ribbon protein
MKPEQSAKLKKWQDKFSIAEDAYADLVKELKEYDKLYEGTRSVNSNPNKKKQVATKEAINVRNIVYELVESQNDASIPMPKVSPVHPEDVELAQKVEYALENQIRRLHFAEMNDLQERTVPICGGDYFFVEWDNQKGYHCTIGDLSVTTRAPEDVIPQPGVTKVEDMDYMFIKIQTTRDAIKAKYNVEVPEARNTDIENTEGNYANQEEILTVVKCFYKHDGVIGLLTWCDDYVLEDFEDYQARRLWRCVKCGRVKEGDECECGSKKFKQVVEDEEELVEDTVIFGNEVLPAIQPGMEMATDPVTGEPMLDEQTGKPIMIATETRTKIPYYKPDCMPVILRKNVSKKKKLLGFSDVKVIEDQQDAVKKYGSKLQEKILKGGSVLTKPKDLQITTTDEELKVIEVRNAADVEMIQAKNLTPDITMDRIMLETNYDWAKSTLGITDAYQGKYDASATSGTAKQYSINQAAGRLESKRIMKNTAYAKLYELMFKFMLAYADQPIPLSRKNNDGQYEFSHFNRYEFLKRDASGELYWNDEFLFEVDPTSTIMMNREAMWQMIDLKYQSGAFGQIGTPEASLAYWTFLAENDYPNAETMKRYFQQKVEEQKQQQAMMAQMQMAQAAGVQMGGMPNEMPQM